MGGNHSATSNSLILLNESLSTTTPGESFLLARDVLRILRLLGARAIYTTHIHDLAKEVDRLNGKSPGSGRIVSLISLVEDGRTGDGGALDGEGPGEPPQSVRRTFKIQPGTPAAYSYAREIAANHGVSYEQLQELLRKRGVLS